MSRLFKGREEIDLTDGDIALPLFYLSLPIVVTNLLRTAYNLADTFWVGQYSTDALAAISFAFPIVFLLIALGLGIAVAGSVLVAQHVGAGNEEKAAYAASQTVSYAAVASVVLGAAGYLFMDEYIAWLGAEPGVLGPAVAYMRIISLGIFFMFGFAVFIALMRGYGDTVTPMLVMLGSVVLNIAIDPFLIFGWWVFPRLGVEGAAIATVFSRGLAFLVGLGIMFVGDRGPDLDPAHLLPDLGFLRTLLGIGIPASVEGTSRAVSVNLLLFIVGTFATEVVAGFGVGIRVLSVMFLPAIAVGRGVETMTGQNIGAGKPDRAKRANDVAAVGMFAILSALAAVVWLTAPAVVDVFTDNPDVVGFGTQFLRFVAPSFGFIGVMRAYSGGFRGAGRTLVAAAIAICMLGLVRLPLAWVLSGTMGTTGLWLSFPISNVAGGLIAYLWFRRGTWRQAEPETLGPGPNVDADPDLLED